MAPQEIDCAVTLREVTADTVRAICRLEVAPEQKDLVAPNSVSIAQAHFEPAAWFRGIYADDEPVGFAMLYDPTRTPAPEDRATCYLWRFMIAAPYQRRGYGAAALAQLISHARTLDGVQSFALSYVPGACSPRDFYARFGFRESGEMDDGEVVMRLHLVPVAQ
jgi:diamine N-acetyltransferase